jgi:hypothetical protein
MLNSLNSVGVLPEVVSARPLQGLSLEQLQRWPGAEVSTFGRRSYLSARYDRLWLLKSGVVRTMTYQEDGTAIALGLWSTGDMSVSPSPIPILPG